MPTSLMALIVPLLHILPLSSKATNAYRVTLESIRVVKAAEAGNDKELYGKIWAGVFCTGHNQQQGSSFDSRERSLVLFERSAENYIRAKEGQPVHINKSLTFDVSDCPNKESNISVQIGLNDLVEAPLENLGTLAGNDGMGAGCPSEKVLVYFTELAGTAPLRKTVNCYNRSVHIQFVLVFRRL